MFYLSQDLPDGEEMESEVPGGECEDGEEMDIQQATASKKADECSSTTDQPTFTKGQLMWLRTIIPDKVFIFQIFI